MPALSRFTVEVAGRVFGFEAEDPAWTRALEPRYGGFRTERAPGLVCRLESLPALRDAAALAQFAAEPLTLSLRPGSSGRAVELDSLSISGWLDLARGRGRIAAPVHRHAVDVALRALLTLTVPEGLLLHGALVVDGERAFLAAGPSGSGKSTLARLLAARALCDEVSLVERTAEGWRAHALPFWHGRPGGGRLAGIRLLTHAERHRCSTLPLADAIRRLAAEVLWPTFSAERSDAALELLERLVAEVPVAELGFVPRADVWPVLVAGPADGAA